MAFATYISTGKHPGLRSRVATMIDAVRSGLAQRKLYNDTLSELQQLGDRELADLGLHRSMLRSIAYNAAYEN